MGLECCQRESSAGTTLVHMHDAAGFTVPQWDVNPCGKRLTNQPGALCCLRAQLLSLKI